MSATIDTPRGLDSLTADEAKLMESMRDDSPAPDEPIAPAPAAPLSAETTEDFEVDIPDAPEAAPTATQRQTTVPQQALHAEREKRKAAEKRADEAAAALAAASVKKEKDDAVLQARLDMIARAMETAPAAPLAPVAAPAEEPLPDKTTDPIGYFEALTGRLQKTVDTQGAMLTGFTEAQRQRQAVQELRRWGELQELAFEAQEPAYREAMTFLRKSRHDELEAIGIFDAAERERIIGNDVAAIFTRARQEAAAGRAANPAQRLFAAAGKRGFAKVVPPPLDPTPTAPAIPPLDAPATPDEDRALRLAAARDNATTIGSLGSAPPVRLSAQKIADMPEKDFAVLYERIKDNPAALRQLMGD